MRFNFGIEGVLSVNFQDRDNHPIKDKIRAPNVSIIQCTDVCSCKRQNLEN